MNSIPYVVSKHDGESRQYDIFSRMLCERIIFVNGEINDNMADNVVAQLLFLESEDPKKEICMYINSPGGAVTAGLAIYDTMRYLKCPVHTICVGQACSMGSILLVAGDKRSILPYARVLIHQPSGGASGKASDVETAIKELMRVKDITAGILAEHTKQSKETILKDIEYDHVFNAQEALEYGLIDRIILSQKGN